MTSTSTARSLHGRFNRLLMLLLKLTTIGILLLTLAAEMTSALPDQRPPMMSWVAWTQFAVALFVIGWFKAKTTVGRPGRSGLQMLLIGIVAALAGFGIAYLVGVAGI